MMRKSVSSRPKLEAYFLECYMSVKRCCRPFLLPCVVTAAFGLFTIVCTVAFLEETHPVAKNTPGGWPGHVLRLLLRLLTCTALSKKAADAGDAPGELSSSSNADSACLAVFLTV